ncbi:MAG TPA: N-formylglutamate amidohydrolase, partial [Polyangiaceae bacterium]|nr:N-formylglutamate amidohydrolase [Polyangiaceae bacterium]
MLLQPDEPPAVTVVRPAGRASAVLICDHASNRLPRALGDLGLPASRFSEHIAWDIGAANVARRMSERLDAPLVLSGYSRLVIDCNRPLGVATSMPELTCGVEVPGNAGLSPEASQARIEELFRPYHRAIEGILEERGRAGLRSAILSVHSFTPEPLRGPRPWDVGILYKHGEDQRLADLLMDALRREPGIEVGDNQPYQVTSSTDYGIPVYAIQAGRPGVLIEVRQDHIATAEEAQRWGDRLADAFLSIEGQLSFQ